jgi:hypothetical protein
MLTIIAEMTQWPKISLNQKRDERATIDDRLHYWNNYQRRLRRAYYGEKFGAEAEHNKWLPFMNDETRHEPGQGYRDGLNFTGEVLSAMSILDYACPSGQKPFRRENDAGKDYWAYEELYQKAEKVMSD